MGIHNDGKQDRDRKCWEALRILYTLHTVHNVQPTLSNCSHGHHEAETETSFSSSFFILCYPSPHHSSRALQPPMHKPTKALPQHLIPPPQPLNIHLPRQLHNPHPKRQLHLALLPLLHIHPLTTPLHHRPRFSFLPLPLPPIRPLPHILPCLTNTRRTRRIPGPAQVERREESG